jgi:aryl-alcohol dehydrogenase-like predicted oxidoreductase
MPSLRRLAQLQSKRVVRGGDFSVDAAKRSLETSLTALGIDTIDVWLLHDCQLEHCTDALYAFLEDAQSSGLIRTFGVGTSVQNIADILTHAPAFARVIQLENSVFTPNLARLRREFDLDAITDRIVTHRALSGLGDLHRLINRHPSVAATWSDKLDVNVRDRDVVASLMLATAYHENHNGAVLFSSTTPNHIRQNSAVVAENPFSEDQIDMFLALCQTELPSMTAHPQS